MVLRVSSNGTDGSIFESGFCSLVALYHSRCLLHAAASNANTMPASLPAKGQSSVQIAHEQVAEPMESRALAGLAETLWRGIAVLVIARRRQCFRVPEFAPVPQRAKWFRTDSHNSSSAFSVARPQITWPLQPLCRATCKNINILRAKQRMRPEEGSTARCQGLDEPQSSILVRCAFTRERWCLAARMRSLAPAGRGARWRRSFSRACRAAAWASRSLA
jgi:hypothetical protein